MSDVHEAERLDHGAMVDWRPLLDLVGERLAEHFMWMHRITLEDRALVHLYKHVDTRRYLHVATDGRTFVFVPENSYREVTPRWAIATAFHRWDEIGPPLENADVVRAELARRTRAPYSSEDEPLISTHLLRGVEG